MGLIDCMVDSGLRLLFWFLLLITLLHFTKYISCLTSFLLCSLGRWRGSSMAFIQDRNNYYALNYLIFVPSILFIWYFYESIWSFERLIEWIHDTYDVFSNWLYTSRWPHIVVEEAIFSMENHKRWAKTE